MDEAGLNLLPELRSGKVFAFRRAVNDSTVQTYLGKPQLTKYFLLAIDATIYFAFLSKHC